MSKAPDMQAARAEALRSMAKRRTKRLDEAKLFILGYKQELKRELSFASNSGCTMLLASCFLLADLYSSLGLTYGGPVVMIWAWVAVSLALLCTAACAAELVSAFPTSGGLYYFSFILAPPKWRQFLCYMTGWLNLVAQIMCTTATELTFLTFLVTVISLHQSGPEEGPGWIPTKLQLVGIYAAILVVHAVVSCLGSRVTSGVLSLGFFWHIIAAPVFMGLLFVIAPVKQPTKWVFTEWMPNTDIHGISSPILIAVMGVLMGQWLMIIFDSGIHLCEETVNGGTVASWSIMSGVGFSALLGLLMLVTVNYCVQSIENLSDPGSVTGGKALAQMVWDVFKARYGTGWGSMPLLYMAVLPLFLSGPASLVANSRMVYAFSRDGAMLGSKLWRKVDQRTGVPINAVIMMACMSFLMGTYAIYDAQVNYGVYCTLVVALNLSLLIPIACRVSHGTTAFLPGPFWLGRFGVPMGIFSCLWLIFTTIIFCLPPVYPPEKATFNCSPLILGAVLLLTIGVWCINQWRGVNWFEGPTPNLDKPDDTVHGPSAQEQAPGVHTHATSSQAGYSVRGNATGEIIPGSARQSLAGFTDVRDTRGSMDPHLAKAFATGRSSHIRMEPQDDALKFAIDSYEDGRLEAMLMGQVRGSTREEFGVHPPRASRLVQNTTGTQRRRASARSATFTVAPSTIEEGKVLGLNEMLHQAVHKARQDRPTAARMSEDGKAGSSVATYRTSYSGATGQSHSPVHGSQPRSLALELSTAIATNARRKQQLSPDPGKNTPPATRHFD